MAIKFVSAFDLWERRIREILKHYSVMLPINQTIAQYGNLIIFESFVLKGIQARLKIYWFKYCDNIKFT